MLFFFLFCFFLITLYIGGKDYSQTNLPRFHYRLIRKNTSHIFPGPGGETKVDWSDTVSFIT